MSSYVNIANRMVTCPYDPAHRMKESKFQMHIIKCRQNHLDSDKKECPFNAQHRVDSGSLSYHIMHECPDRACVDKKLAATVDKNNMFKGRTAVPSYTPEVPVADGSECWDEDISPIPAPLFVPKNQPPSGAIIQPADLAKPAERRKFYQELHRINNEDPKPEETPPEVVDPKPIFVERQPKGQSEAQLFFSQQRVENPRFQSLGLGRGAIASALAAENDNRIAAQIFTERQPMQPPSYSEVAHGMNQLGIGRGLISAASPPPPYDEADYPPFGIGRGSQRVNRGYN